MFDVSLGRGEDCRATAVKEGPDRWGCAKASVMTLSVAVTSASSDMTGEGVGVAASGE